MLRRGVLSWALPLPRHPSPSTMILIRHGETLFNLHYGATRVDPGTEDPGLTAKGRTQAAAAARAHAEEDVAALGVCPYRRTLEPAEHVAAALDLPITHEPQIRAALGFNRDH